MSARDREAFGGPPLDYNGWFYDSFDFDTELLGRAWPLDFE